MDNNVILTYDRLQERTKVLGPGERAVVWFHGCSRRCPGCVASEMNASMDFASATPEELVARIARVKGIEGVTISGGEPFQQNLEAMHWFLRGIRESTALGMVAYTGYLIAELRDDAERRRLLEYIDVLVDGPYVEELDEGQLWRGSGNQTIHFLSDRYRALASSVVVGHGRPLEFDLSRPDAFSFTGIPPRGFRKNLEKELMRKGLDVAW